MDFVLFLFVSFVIIIIPGPNVLVIISTSISHGKKRGLQTLLGTSAALVIQLFLAALATTYFVTLLAEGFLWLKWMGVAYLLYLGINHFIAAYSSKGGITEISALGSFQRGFWVSLTNPKTILFFSAFLPQFVDPTASYTTQITLLSISFWILAVIFDGMYALLSSQLKGLTQVNNGERYQNGLSGAIYCVASALLAGSQKA